MTDHRAPEIKRVNGKRPVPAGFASPLCVFSALLILTAFAVVTAWYFAPRHPSSRTDYVEGVTAVQVRHLVPDKIEGPRRFTREEVEAMYETHVAPLIETMHGQNRAAVDRILQDLQRDYQQFYAGIEPFVNDLSGYGTRFGVTGRFLSDAVRNWREGGQSARSLENYIAAKFERHVITEGAVRGLVQAALEQYLQETTANRNQLLVAIRQVLHTESIPLGGLMDAAVVENFDKAFSAMFTAVARELSINSVGYGLASLVAGELAGVACAKAAPYVASAVTQVITRLAAPLAASLTTSVVANVSLQTALCGLTTGGAAAKGALIGGATGTSIGPIGTAGGLIAGIAIGLVIDLWMTRHFEEKAQQDIQNLLNTLYSSLVVGGKTHQGLHPMFLDANNHIHAMTVQATKNMVLEGQ